MGVARNVCFDPRLVPGGGAVEMAVSHSLSGRADNIQVAASLHVKDRTPSWLTTHRIHAFLRQMIFAYADNGPCAPIRPNFVPGQNS